MPYSARIIKDSICNDNRLTTWELKYWRAVHDELLTHRELSRCTASARAIPMAKMIDMVMTDTALPVEWGTNKPGMQPGDEVSDEIRDMAIARILRLRDQAVECAYDLHNMGLHKQIVNRYLQPFAFTTVLVSTTSHSNLFGLRCHPAAQAEIRHVVLMMRDLLADAVPKKMNPGEWHLPFIDDEEFDMYGVEHSCKISAGRCARVSYLNHEGKRNVADDIGLFNRLVSGLEKEEPGHMSPLEHVAQAMGPVAEVRHDNLSKEEIFINDALQCSGNFRGWKQLRKFFKGEYIGGTRR